MHRALLLMAGLLLWTSCGEAQARAPVRRPVVVELYTSQGCSSCVKADGVLDELADQPGVLALTLAVDYWDYLGWNDTFAKPEFSARQRAYMQRLSSREVYTPQIVVDGRGQAAGADRPKVLALISDAKRASPPRAPHMRFLRHSRLAVGAGRAPPGGADVWLLRYFPGVQEVMVKRGENRGQTLSERNVVRELKKLGTWRGRSRTFAVPAPQAPDGLRTVILLQAAKGGRILGVLQK